MARRRSKEADAALGLGCLIIIVGGFVLSALVAVLGAIASLFLTPIPYVLLAMVAAGYVIHRVREERLKKLYFDAVAAIERLPGSNAASVDRLWASRSTEADLLVLQAALLAQSARNDDALRYLHAAGSKAQRIGALSGGAALWFPGLLEPLWFGGTPATSANLHLAYGQLQALAGRTHEAVQTLAPRLHEPHFAAALGALADAYARAGRLDRAAAVLQQWLYRVADPSIQRDLRYRVAVYLDEAGSSEAAGSELRRVLVSGDYADARQRLQRIDGQRAASRERALVAQDEAAFNDAVARVRDARGPKSRERALEAGLARLQQPHMRELLLLEASRLEVEAVLERVAGLKTKKAKERNLREALDRLLSDDVPDELQREEIAMLQQALGALEAGQ